MTDKCQFSVKSVLSQIFENLVIIKACHLEEMIKGGLGRLAVVEEGVRDTWWLCHWDLALKMLGGVRRSFSKMVGMEKALTLVGVS